MKLQFPLPSSSFILFLILSVTSMVACGPSPEELATMTANAWTSTPTGTATITMTHTYTPTPTSTFTPTPSPSETQTPTVTHRPTNTQDPRRYYAPDNSFSLVPPENWVPRDMGLEYPVLMDPALVNLGIGLRFFQQEYPFPVAIYSALFQDALIPGLENYSLVSEEFSTTEEGMEVFRWEYTHQDQGILYRQEIFFFEAGDWKLVISFSRPDNQAQELDGIIHEVMNTVRYDR